MRAQELFKPRAFSAIRSLCSARARNTVRIAVGTAVAGGPPHRSVRECLPHTAPPLGITVKTSLPAVAARHDALQSPARWPVQESSERPFPWVIPFPPRTPPPGFRFCSSASQVLWDHLTSHGRTCRLYRLRRFPAVPISWKPVGSPGSRAWDVCACTGSVTPPRPSTTLPRAVVTMLPSPRQDKVGTRKW